MKSRSAHVIFILLISASIVGCATSRMYSGPSMPEDKVAFLERGDLAQSLEQVDSNKSINFFLLNSAVEILPGNHTISVGYGDGKKRGLPYTLTFTAEAGVRYVIKSNVVNSKWKPNIIEKESKKIVNYIPVNLIPMYGYPKYIKSKNQKKIDDKFIQSEISRSGSREKSAIEFSAWGWSERQNGNIDNAMRRFNQSWLLNQNYYQPYWGFGAIFLKKKNPEEASIYFNKALNLIRDDQEKPRLLIDASRAFSSQAILYKKNNINKSKDLYHKANSLIEEALKLDPKYGKAYSVGALTYYSQGDFKNALRIVEKSQETNAYKFDAKFLESLSNKLKNSIKGVGDN